MPTYVVEGLTRGRLYSGPSLDVALATLQRDVRDCLFLHHGPSDALLYCDGVPVETEMAEDGTLQLATARPHVEYPLPKVTKKHWQR